MWKHFILICITLINFILVYLKYMIIYIIVIILYSSNLPNHFYSVNKLENTIKFIKLKILYIYTYK